MIKCVIAQAKRARRQNRTCILEVYKSQQAYAAHLKTAHFLKYKTQTAHMVKDLKLIDLESLDPATMPAIFKKMH